MQPRSMPVYAPQPQPQQQQARPGTLAAGTAVSVGKYKVTIDRFLSEGAPVLSMYSTRSGYTD